MQRISFQEVNRIDIHTVVTKTKTIKISANFPEPLWKSLKARALEDEETVTDILIRLSKDYVRGRNLKKPARVAPDPSAFPSLDSIDLKQIQRSLDRTSKAGRRRSGY